MFETRFPVGTLEGPTPNGSADSFRRLSWAEIVSRIDGMQQIRRLMQSSHTAFAGRFDPAAARRLALLEDGIQAVNPTGLANSKARERRVLADDDTHCRGELR